MGKGAACKVRLHDENAAGEIGLTEIAWASKGSQEEMANIVALVRFSGADILGMVIVLLQEVSLTIGSRNTLCLRWIQLQCLDVQHGTSLTR